MNNNIIKDFKEAYKNYIDEYHTSIDRKSLTFTNIYGNLITIRLDSGIRSIRTEDPSYNYDIEYINFDPSGKLKELEEIKKGVDNEIDAGGRDLSKTEDRVRLNELLDKKDDIDTQISHLKHTTNSVNIILPGYSTEPVNVAMPLFRYKIFNPKDKMCCSDCKLPKKLIDLHFITVGLDVAFNGLQHLDEDKDGRSLFDIIDGDKNITRIFLDAMFILMKTVKISFTDSIDTVNIPLAILVPNLLDATYEVLKWCVSENDLEQKRILGCNSSVIDMMV